MDSSDLISQLKNRPLVGILKISSTYKYPQTKRGVPQYVWLPLSSGSTSTSSSTPLSSIPEFLVPSTVLKNWLKNPRTSGHPPDHYAIIQFKEWPSKVVRPKGMIQTLIGPVGDWTAEALARAYYHQLALPKLKELILPIKHSVDDPRQIFEKVPHRDCLDLSVYSIDPVGCRDIDDAFSFEQLTVTSIRVGIHIADVTFFLTRFGWLEQPQFFQDRYASVYLPTTIRHLLPEALSTQLASLIPGQPRLAWTLWLTVDLSDHNQPILTESGWERTLIRNQKAFSYQEVDQKKLLTTHPILKELSPIIRNLRQTILGDDQSIQNLPAIWTSHELIETLMLIANHLTAKFLHSVIPSQMLYRIHQSTQLTVDCSKFDPELSRFLNILQSRSAVYTREPIDQSYYHAGLQLNFYTHFTSPIRRFPDIWIHLLLAQTLYQEPLPFQLSQISPLPLLPPEQAINDFMQRTKRLQRDLDFLQIVQQLAATEQTLDPVQNGYLINRDEAEKSEESPKLYFYLPTPKLLLSFYPLAEELQHQIRMIDQPKQIEFHRLTDKLSSNTPASLIIPKHELIQVRLVAFPQATSFKRKLTVMLPGLAEFLADS